MLLVIRQGSIEPGCLKSAVAFAAKVATYVKERHKVDISVLRPVGGDPLRVSWRLSFADMQAYEATHNALAADMAYIELVDGAGDMFSDFHDEIWQGR